MSRMRFQGTARRSRILFVAACIFAHGGLFADESFVWPGNQVDPNTPLWGHRNGLRIGLAPTPGPRGLIRIYAPYLDQSFPRVVNFLSIEPSVQGQRGRDQSELQMSRDQPGKRGLSFWATNDRDGRQADRPVTGSFDAKKGTLRLFVHTETFQNSARPIIEIIFRRDQPHELELVTHAHHQSATMTSCVLSATMGNYGLLRQIHLAHGRVESAPDLWKTEDLDRLGFLPWRTWVGDQLQRTPDGRTYVRISTDSDDPAKETHAPDVTPHWIYVGKKATHYWRVATDLNPTAAVNGRKTFWMSKSPIPGGKAFENFEIRVPYATGNRLWFGVRPDP